MFYTTLSSAKPAPLPLAQKGKPTAFRIPEPDPVPFATTPNTAFRRPASPLRPELCFRTSRAEAVDLPAFLLPEGPV